MVLKEGKKVFFVFGARKEPFMLLGEGKKEGKKVGFVLTPGPSTINRQDRPTAHEQHRPPRCIYVHATSALPPRRVRSWLQCRHRDRSTAHGTRACYRPRAGGGEQARCPQPPPPRARPMAPTPPQGPAGGICSTPGFGTVLFRRACYPPPPPLFPVARGRPRSKWSSGNQPLRLCAAREHCEVIGGRGGYTC